MEFVSGRVCVVEGDCMMSIMLFLTTPTCEPAKLVPAAGNYVCGYIIDSCVYVHF